MRRDAALHAALCAVTALLEPADEDSLYASFAAASVAAGAASPPSASGGLLMPSVAHARPCPWPSPEGDAVVLAAMRAVRARR